MNGARRLVGLLVLLSLAAHAQSVPPLTGRVVDRADVLTSAAEDALTALLADHEAATGNQIVVLTMATLDGYSVEEYATEVFNTWELGQADDDNGVLVLIARDDREMRIEVGYGLEDPLTDSRAGRIIRSDFLPSFRNGDYDAGTLAGVDAILGVIDGTYEPPDGGAGGGADVPLFMRLMFGLMFCLMPLLAFVPSFLVAGQPGGLVFAGIFIVVGAGVVTVSIVGALLVLVLYVVALLLAEAWLRNQEGITEARAAIRKALEENEGRRVTVTLGGMTMTLGGITQGGGSGGSGGGFSSGGGGGGFSGGGGSSGGGGASGSW